MKPCVPVHDSFLLLHVGKRPVAYRELLRCVGPARDGVVVNLYQSPFAQKVTEAFSMDIDLAKSFVRRWEERKRERKREKERERERDSPGEEEREKERGRREGRERKRQIDLEGE